MRFRDFSLKIKISILLGILFFFFVLGITVTNYYLSKDIAEGAATSELENITISLLTTFKAATVSMYKNTLRSAVRNNKRVIEMFYNQYKNGKITEIQAMENAKKALLSQKIGLSGYFYVLNSKGVLQVHPKTQLVNKNMTRFDFVKKQISHKKGFIEYDWKNPGEKKARQKVLYMSYFKFWDWIISASAYKEDFVKMLNVKNFRKDILAIKIGKTGYPYIINTKGKLIVHPAKEGENIYNVKDSSGRYFIRQLIKKKTGYIVYPWTNSPDVAPRDKIVYFKYYPFLKWIIAAGAYVEEIHAPYIKTRNISITLVIFLFILTIPALYFIVSAIMKPLSGIVDKIYIMAEGDLTKEFYAKSNDDIGKLTKSIRDFANKIRVIIISLKQYAVDVKQGTLVLNDNVNKSKNTIDIVANSVEHITKSAMSQAEIVAETTKEVNNIINAINTLSAEIEQQSASVEESSAAIEQLAASINNVAATAEKAGKISEGLVENAKTGGESIQRTIDAIHAIEQASSRVNEIVDIINGISEQTNLLAMNAAIEAAHAGDYGKGFAVVADEIRKLAENSQASAKEIVALIKEINAKIKTTTELTGVVTEGLDKILNGVDNTSEINAEISNSMSEQSIAAKEILKQISSLVDITENVRHSIIEQKESTGRISGTVEKLETTNENIISEVNEANENSGKMMSSFEEVDSVAKINEEIVAKLENVFNSFKINSDIKTHSITPAPETGNE